MKFFDFFRRKEQPKTTVTETAKAVLSNGVELSPELSAYKSQIENTALPFIRIEATPSENISITQSNFGGKPYWPIGRPYPSDSDGNYLLLLAQLNFAEMPALDGYPDKGLLQFYISTNDLFGLNFNAPTDQTSFRIIYFETTDEAAAETDFSFLEDMNIDCTPLDKSLKLSFSKEVDYVGSGDVRFRQAFGTDLYSFATNFKEKEDEVGEELWDKFPTGGHKVGGYAYFTQDDPRSYTKEYEDWILLLQIDSDDNIMWGDMGVANFFIHPDALRQKDFSNVLYNWDCG